MQAITSAIWLLFSLIMDNASLSDKIAASGFVMDFTSFSDNSHCSQFGRLPITVNMERINVSICCVSMAASFFFPFTFLGFT